MRESGGLGILGVGLLDFNGNERMMRLERGTPVPCFD